MQGLPKPGIESHRPYAALAGILLIITISVSRTALADGDVYKIRRADGHIEYSDKAPASAAEATRMPQPPQSAGVVLAPPGVIEDTRRQVTERITNQNRQIDAVAAAEAKLRAAAKAKADGEEPGPGERQRLVNGKSRLNENYVQRQEQLDRNVAQAQAELEAARSAGR